MARTCTVVTLRGAAAFIWNPALISIIYPEASFDAWTSEVLRWKGENCGYAGVKMPQLHLRLMNFIEHQKGLRHDPAMRSIKIWLVQGAMIALMHIHKQKSDIRVMKRSMNQSLLILRIWLSGSLFPLTNLRVKPKKPNNAVLIWRF